VAVAGKPQGPFAAKIHPVQPAIDPQGFGQPARPARQIAQLFDSAIVLHDRDAFQRL
jgi:hypothetical protein